MTDGFYPLKLPNNLNFEANFRFRGNFETQKYFRKWPAYLSNFQKI